MSNKGHVPILYNLFPRLAGTMPHWIEHAYRALDVGFNMIYINSFHYTGFSGSLYAVKNHYQVNPDFLLPYTEGNGLDLLKSTLRKLQDIGLSPIMDLVINHTSRDSPLIHEHPQWYAHDEHGKVVSPFAIDPNDPNKVTVWGDLAEIDNAKSSDRAALWDYWAELITFYLKLGFKGFRCDAAYKVPSELWQYLIRKATRVDSEVLFFAETLGCREEEVMALQNAGLHYIFNSSKWWDFEQPWCLEQHEKFGKIAPSISFPETHDTNRLAADTNGNEAIQRQRYAFASIFSAGLMMPIGYEFGFKNKLDVVRTRPADWEVPAFDLRHFIKRVNQLKIEHPLLHGEGTLKKYYDDSDILIIRRNTSDAPGKTSFILINKQNNKPASITLKYLLPQESRHSIYFICRDDAPLHGIPDSLLDIELRPAEVVLVLQ